MIGRTNTGSGGGGLNYKIVGGTTAPSATKKNTIWINTSTKITSWIFSATEPKNPVSGMVWIIVGLSSRVEFSVTKENSIMIYPLSAKQYVSGAWVNKTAKTWDGSKWVDWFVETIYNAGDFGFAHTAYKSPSNAEIVYNSNNIALSTVAGKTSEAYVVFGPVDLSLYKTLTLKGTFVKKTTSTFSNVATLFVAPNVSTSYKNATAIETLIKKTTYDAGGSYEVNLNVSSLNGEFYIYGGLNTQGSGWESIRQNTITSLKGTMV